MSATVKISSKYQVVIPRNIRRMLNLRPGQEVTVIAVGGLIEIVPCEDLESLRGAYPNLSLDDIRDESERDFA